MLNNTNIEQVKQAPEALDYILKHSILSTYGAAYTISNLDDELWQDLMYMQACMSAEANAAEMASKKAQFYGGAEIAN